MSPWKNGGLSDFFIVARFRQPVIPLFCIFAGYAIIWTLKKIMRFKIIALIPLVIAFWYLLSFTDHDKRTYKPDQSSVTGILLKLAVQEDFGKADIYRKRLIKLWEKEASKYLYNADIDFRLYIISEAFKEFQKASFYPYNDSRRHLYYAKGYYHLLGITQDTQFHLFISYIENYVNKALEIDPDIQGAYKTLAKSYIEQIQRNETMGADHMILAEAYKYFLMELEHTPNDPECLKALGFCSQIFNNIPKAVDFYKEYLKHSDTWDHEIASQLSSFYITDPKLRDTTILFAEDAYKHDPSNIVFCKNYSFALYVMGRFDDAIKVLKEMIKIDSKSTETYRKRIADFKIVKKKKLKDKETNKSTQKTELKDDENDSKK